MKKYSLYIVMVFSLLFIARFNNPPNGRTGAPGEGTCQASGCHNSGGANHTANVALSGFPANLDGGITYTISLTANMGGAIPANPKLGFQLTVLDENNNTIGTIGNPSPSATITPSGGRTYAEHSPGLNSSNNTWTVDFTAPSSSSSNQVTVYAVINAANGNGNTSGDIIVTTTMNAGLTATSDPLAAMVMIEDHVDCFSGMDGKATVTVSGGPTGNYSYLWDNGETTATATSLTAGLHTIQVTDMSETVIESVTILEPEALVYTVTEFMNATCYNIVNARVELIINGGIEPYKYLWSTGQTTNPLRNVPGGNYILTVSDGNDCQLLFDTTFVQPNEITLNIEIDSVSCGNAKDGAIRIAPSGGTGEYTYFWSTGDIVSGVTNLAVGEYSLTVMDDNGCQTMKTIEVFGQDSISLNVNIRNITCYGMNDGHVDISLSGGVAPYSIAWSNGSDSTLISELDAQLYTVTITDSENCPKVSEFQISQPDSILFIIESEIEGCPESYQGLISLRVSGGTSPYHYIWSNGSTDSIMTDINNKHYSFTITDANNCQSSHEDSLDIVEGITVIANINSESSVSAEDGLISIEQIFGGFGIRSWEWSTGSSDSTISNLNPGIYTLSVLDSNNCSYLREYEILEYTCKLALNLLPLDPLCYDECSGSVMVNITNSISPITYQWNINSTSKDIDQLCSGAYSLTASDENGCFLIDSVVLTDPNPIFIQIDSIQYDFGSGGAIFTTAIGGTGTLTLTVLKNGTDSVGVSNLDFDFLNVPAGNYIVLVIDRNGCERNSIMLTVPLKTGIDEKLASQFTLSPIPANDLITLEMNQSYQIESLEIINIAGVTVKELDYNQDRYIHVSNLQPGVYWMKIHLTDGNIALKKWLKQ